MTNGRLMARFFYNDNSGEFGAKILKLGEGNTNSSSLYHHSHFLAATLDFTFFHNGLLGGCTLLLQLGFFVGFDFTSFCNYIQCSWHYCRH